MEFKSQICTTKEQSEKLLSLGLKRETADMYITDMSSKGINYTDDWQIGTIPYCKVMSFSFWGSNLLQLEKTAWSIIPAWSLHRLMCLCPVKLGPDDGARYGGERLNCFCGEGNVYNAIISCIEWLINTGNFNKEYLEEVVI